MFEKSTSALDYNMAHFSIHSVVKNAMVDPFPFRKCVVLAMLTALKLLVIFVLEHLSLLSGS